MIGAATLKWLAEKAGSLGFKWLETRLTPAGSPRSAESAMIEITSPAQGDRLNNPKEEDGEIYYEVHGNVRGLPAGREIWLLVEKQDTNEIWPQGFYTPKPDATGRFWTGRVWGKTTKGQRKIHAVVAPQASCQLFRYYQMVGNAHENRFVPLDRIPDECTPRHAVQVEFLT